MARLAWGLRKSRRSDHRGGAGGGPKRRLLQAADVKGFGLEIFVDPFLRPLAPQT